MAHTLPFSEKNEWQTTAAATDGCSRPWIFGYLPDAFHVKGVFSVQSGV